MMLRRRAFIGARMVVLLLVVAACSSISTAGLPTPVPQPTFVDEFPPEPVGGSGPPPGTWTGTITFHAVIDYDKSEPGHSDLDPDNVYYATWVTNESVHLDATDTFNVSGVDDDDLTYGIRSVDLEGSATNSGTTDEKYSTLTDKRNSGCTWKEDSGSETSGSWSGSGEAVGDIRFSEDGSYSIQIRADSTDYAELPHNDFLRYSDISANCEISFAPYDLPDERGPLVEWVSSQQGQLDVTGTYMYIDGQMNASNPGSVVEGSSTWEISFPEGLTITITWRLQHSSPIVLPHS